MSEPKIWFAVDAVVAADGVSAVETAFDVLETLGTETSSLRKKPGEDITVSGFFADEPDELIVQKLIDDLLDSFGVSLDAIRSIEIRKVVEEDWLAEWKRHWQPTEVGRFVVAPPWSDVAGDGRIVVRIDPNMAFGTGTHDTTRLCIGAIDRLYLAGKSFLDVGTGTGILAISAAKLGRGDERIFACDTDLDSVRIARENAEANGVGERIEFAEGPLEADSATFDFVCANLTLDVILPILPLLFSKTDQTLVLSGILVEQEPRIRAALVELGFHDPQIEYSGEWLAVIVEITH